MRLELTDRTSDFLKNSYESINICLPGDFIILWKESEESKTFSNIRQCAVQRNSQRSFSQIFEFRLRRWKIGLEEQLKSEMVYRVYA